MNGTCWTQLDCKRALIVSHGGAWNLEYPYDSFPAMTRAFDEGTDCVKGDFRVSKDGFGVVVHSSPFQFYESLNCRGKRCEQMTALDITTTCRMALTSYHFQNVSSLLQWASQKVIVMLDVKQTQDIPQAIEQIVAANAQNRTFLEIGISDLLTVVPKVPQWRQVYYLANGRSVEDLSIMQNKSATGWLQPNVFAFEYDPHLVPQVPNLQDSLAKLHAAGLRTLTATPTQFEPSVEEHEKLFNEGFDIVYSYNTANGVIARTNIDKQRGVTPPNN